LLLLGDNGGALPEFPPVFGAPPQGHAVLVVTLRPFQGHVVRTTLAGKTEGIGVIDLAAAASAKGRAQINVRELVVFEGGSGMEVALLLRMAPAVAEQPPLLLGPFAVAFGRAHVALDGPAIHLCAGRELALATDILVYCDPRERRPG
jgi:hypothetical protein